MTKDADIRARLVAMDETSTICHILIPLPWLESAPILWRNNPDRAVEACRLANAATAELCQSHPGRFLGAALLPPLAASATSDDVMRVYREAMQQPNLVGSVLFIGPTPESPPPDDERYEPLYVESAENGTPIWLHPCRPQSVPDYSVYGMKHKGSMHSIWNSLGWIYDTSVAMVHMAMGGVFQRHKGLKVIVHHGGGMLPFFVDRFETQRSNFDLVSKEGDCRFQDLRKFYCDTATFGYAPANIAQYIGFFEDGHVLYGTDTPMDMASPGLFTKNALRSIDNLSETGVLSPEGKRKVLLFSTLDMLGRHGNSVRELMGLEMVKEELTTCSPPHFEQ